MPIDPSSQYQSIVLGGSYRAGDVVGVYNDAGTTKAEHPANWQRVVIGDAHSEVAAVNAQSRIVRVDFQRFIVSWVSTTVQLRCGTIASDGSISYGSTVNLSDSDASLGHMFLMADNTVGCTYRTSGGGTARMAILTLAGNVITVNNTGADKQINGSLGAGTLLGSGKIASNKVIAHYTVSGTSTRCAVATWTGTTFSAWTESNYVASAETGQTLGGNSVVTFPTLDDKCVFIANNTTSGTARVVTISGTTPTVNATVNVNSTVFSS